MSRYSLSECRPSTESLMAGHTKESYIDTMLQNRKLCYTVQSQAKSANPLVRCLVEDVFQSALPEFLNQHGEFQHFRFPELLNEGGDFIRGEGSG